MKNDLWFKNNKTGTLQNILNYVFKVSGDKPFPGCVPANLLVA
jgi:hypothetical protein